jgi:CheY-like chemotaxis protein
VDDYPRNNVYEQQVLNAVGIGVENVEATDAALSMARRIGFDLVISDIRRGSQPDAGLQLLSRLRSEGCPLPLLFYVGKCDPSRGVPAGAVAITDKPDTLLDVVFHVLQRQVQAPDRGEWEYTLDSRSRSGRFSFWELARRVRGEPLGHSIMVHRHGAKQWVAFDVIPPRRQEGPGYS